MESKRNDMIRKAPGDEALTEKQRRLDQLVSEHQEGAEAFELTDEDLDMVTGGEQTEQKKPRQKAGDGGKPRGKGQPNAPQTRGVLKCLQTYDPNDQIDE